MHILHAPILQTPRYQWQNFVMDCEEMLVHLQLFYPCIINICTTILISKTHKIRPETFENYYLDIQDHLGEPNLKPDTIGYNFFFILVDNIVFV